MRTEEERDRLRETSLVFVVSTLVVLLFVAFAARLSAQEPATLPVTRVTAYSFPSGQGAKIKGLIIGRQGDDMIVRDQEGRADIVTLTAETKISSPSGLFKMDKKHRDVSNLLPGLIVEIKGSGGDRGNLVADKISFHSSALKVAEQVAAGTVMLKQQVGANTDSINALKDRGVDTLNAFKSRFADSLSAITDRARDSLTAINVRFDNINSYDVKDSASVLFASGSAKLTEGLRGLSEQLNNGDTSGMVGQALDAIVATAMGQPGYLIEVMGFTDAVGGENMNLNLSTRRATAVVDYLIRDKRVPIRRVLNPTGFGEDQPVASNDTAAGRSENRRAQVKVLVNRAVVDRK